MMRIGLATENTKHQTRASAHIKSGFLSGGDSMISQSVLKNLFEYQDGQLVTKKRISQRTSKGHVVGCPSGHGYIVFRLDGKKQYLHRMVFLFHYGFLPEYIDHIDGDRENNKIENLRECTPSQNSHNAKSHIKNKSGVKGVSWCKRKRKWRAYLTVDYKFKNLGTYKSISEAKEAVINGRQKYHHNFSNNGES